MLRIGNIQTFELETDNITFIEFRNNLQNFVPEIVLKYTDYNNRIAAYVRKNGVLLTIAMSAAYSTGNTINKTFYVDKFDVVPAAVNSGESENTRTKTYYDIVGLDVNILKLLEHPNYATIDNIEESPYNIIYNILRKIDYNFEELPYDTDQTINFINAQRMEALDIIDYCLHRAISRKTPPAYFMTKLLTGEGQLFGGQSNITNDNVYSFGAQVNKFDLNATENLTKENAISNVTTNSPTEGVITYKNLETDKFYTYDHIHREWTTEEYSQNDKLNILNSADKVGSYKTTLISKASVDINKEDYIRIYPNFRKTELYPIMQDLELGNNVITFSIMGNLSYDCGQFVILNSGDESQRAIYQGVWNVFSVAHRFERRTI